MKKASRVSLLSAAYTLCAVLILYSSEALALPLFLGLLSFLKLGLKIITPKLVLLLIREGFFIKIRQIFIRLSTHFLIFSHKPWRKRVGEFRTGLLDWVSQSFKRYIQAPLWIRCTIALAILLLTASSSYAFIALLIVPKPVIDWIKRLLLRSMNKLGITRVLNAIWNYLVPKSVQHRWQLYTKWTLGRRQINASRILRQRLTQPINPSGRSPGKSSETG